MRKILVVVFALQVLLISCEKEHEREFPCALVLVEQVPVVVKEAFAARYAKIAVQSWYNKDNIGYYVSFELNNTKTLASFKNDGSFIAEMVQDQRGQHHDHENNCGCEVTN